MRNDIEIYITEYLKNHKKSSLSTHIKNSKKDYYETIKSDTIFLDKDSKPSERIYCYLNGITEKVKCVSCDGKIMNFKNLTLGYCSYCKSCQVERAGEANRIKCAALSKDEREALNEKARQTSLKNHGTEYASQSEKIKKKVMETCEERYGTFTTLNLTQVKGAREESLERNKDEINMKRSIAYHSKSEEEKKDINAKRENTSLERYVVKNISTLKKTKEKVKRTNEERHGKSYYVQTDKFKDKARETCRENFGVDYYSQTVECKEKIIKTSNEKYNSDFYLGSNQRKLDDISSGRTIPDSEKDDFYLYKRKVSTITYQHINELFDGWDGKCYYSDENLLVKDSTDYNNVLYPTIDHKISISYGFKNDISPEAIGHKDNLCICSRSENSRKNYLTEDEYKEKNNR